MVLDLDGIGDVKFEQFFILFVVVDFLVFRRHFEIKIEEVCRETNTDLCAVEEHKHKTKQTTFYIYIDRFATEYMEATQNYLKK